MNPSSTSRAGTLLLIIALHSAVLWFILALRSQDNITPPSPLPVVMAEMLQTPQPKAEIPRPQPPAEVKPQRTTKPERTKPSPTPKTILSEKALTSPKQSEQIAEKMPSTNLEPPAPTAAPPAPPAPPAPLTPPRFNAAYLNNPPPVYPPLLRRAGETGIVLLRVFVTAEGTAGEVRVFTPSSSPLFDEAAMEAVRKWRFVPARRGETPVAEWVQVPINFTLN